MYAIRSYYDTKVPVPGAVFLVGQLLNTGNLGIAQQVDPCLFPTRFQHLINQTFLKLLQRCAFGQVFNQVSHPRRPRQTEPGRPVQKLPHLHLPPLPLREVGQDHIESGGRGRGPEVPGPGLRITSYNVCYTKLLRDGGI